MKLSRVSHADIEDCCFSTEGLATKPSECLDCKRSLNSFDPHPTLSAVPEKRAQPVKEPARQPAVHMTVERTDAVAAGVPLERTVAPWMQIVPGSRAAAE
jgi:hypothetical protein